MINREIRHAKSCFPLFVMAEPIYLNYGQNQIDQQAFLEATANNVQNYVAQQPWSNKRKELFMKAYSDIMSKGVTGASNANGIWSVQHNNGQIDLASKSKKEQEMYGEAAYFIQQQMSSITPKAVEDQKKEKLPIFNNEQFNTGLQNYISTNLYGGMDFNQSRWNNRDSLNEYGIRSTTERAKILAQTLRGYANSIESNKYSFEGSPYKDIDTLKTNLNAAANALERGDWNNDTLYKIGIDPEQYLATGVNDIITIGDKQMRRGDAPEYYQQLEANKLKAEQDAKAKEELAKKQQTMQVIKNNPFSKVRIRSGFNNMHGWSLNQIANQYTVATLNDKLNELSGRSDWTPEEQSLVAGAYKHSPKVPISQEEYNTLKAMIRFKDASKSRFSKIQGVDGMIYDSATGSLIMAGDTATNGQTDWLAEKSDKDKEKTYLESKIPGITNAEWKELMAIGADIASIVDPEPISAGVAGVGAAYLRHKAINETPGHKWTFLEGVGQGIDYLTGVIAAIPGFGDATLAAKVLTKINKPLRILGRVGAWKDLYDSVPGLKAAYNKWQNGEELTIGDWRAIGQGIRGLAGHSMLNRTNRGIRKTTIKSGYDATPNGISPMLKGHGKVNDYLARRGWIGTKIADTIEVPVLKVKNADGTSEEIRITPEQKSKLEVEFKKTSKPEERTKAAKNAKVELKEGQTVEVDNNWKTKILPHTTRKISDSLGTTLESSVRKKDQFEDWLKDRDWTTKFYYGSNSALRAYRSRLEITASKTKDTTSSQDSSNTDNNPKPKVTIKEHPLTPDEAKQLKENIKSWKKEVPDLLNVRKKNGREYSWSKNDVKAGTTDRLKSEIKIGEKTFKFEINAEGDLTINGESSGINGFGKSGKRAVRNKIKETIQSQMKSLRYKKDSETYRQFVEGLRKLKAQGFLRQGGIIDKQRIQQYKQFIKK